MNKINQIGIYTCLYILFSLNSKGDLILLTYQYEGYINNLFSFILFLFIQ